MSISRDIVLYMFCCFILFTFIFIPQAYANIGQIDKKIDIEEVLKKTRRNNSELTKLTKQDLKNIQNNFAGLSKNALNVTVSRFQNAAAQGDKHAQVFLGYMYARGMGVSKDMSQAMFWFKKSANNGNVRAQTILGSLYSNGKHIPKDINQARYWYTKAANQGNKKAKKYLKNLNVN
ncbi:MAG: tetratricopeptide repeat protein [Methylococcaceae bacterium]